MFGRALLNKRNPLKLGCHFSQWRPFLFNMDYETLIDVATKIEQQVKEEATKTHEPIHLTDIIRQHRKMSKMEVLTVIYDMCLEAKNNG